jgi:hypothetical protein
MPRRRRSPRQAPQGQHRRPGYVYTTRNGVTGYYADTAAATAGAPAAAPAYVAAGGDAAVEAQPNAQTPGAEQAQQASNADTDQRWPRAQPVAPAARPPSATDRVTYPISAQEVLRGGTPLCDEVEAMAIVRRPADEGEGQAAAAFLAASPITRETPATVASQYAIARETPLVEGEEEEETWEAQQDAFRRKAVALYRGQLVPMFLAAVRCEEYLDRFREAGIDDSALLCLTPADLRTLVGDADTAMRIVESDLLTDFLSALSDREAAGNRAAQMALQVQQLESHADQADRACGDARGVMEELEARLTAARRDWSVKAEASEEAQAQLAEARNERAEAGELVVVADGEVTRAAARTEAALLEARLAALRPFEAAEPPLPAPPPADPGAANECPICLDRERDTAFIPCGHRACAACAGQISLSRCPVCREPFHGTLRVY